MDDFDEFCARVGQEVPTHRECHECGDLCIVNPECYKNPKIECDLETGCKNWLPVCLCTDRILDNWNIFNACTYPDCECSSTDA